MSLVNSPGIRISARIKEIAARPEFALICPRCGGEMTHLTYESRAVAEVRVCAFCNIEEIIGGPELPLERWHCLAKAGEALKLF